MGLSSHGGLSEAGWGEEARRPRHRVKMATCRDHLGTRSKGWEEDRNLTKV
jgi:hypothetical protein